MATTLRTRMGDGRGLGQGGQADVSQGKQEQTHELASHEVYDDFATLAELLQRHTHSSFGCGGMETAVSTSTERTWQFMQDAIVSYEGIKAIRFSATSVGLRYFSYALINLSCLLLAPYWTSFCGDETFGARQSGGLSDELGLGPGAGAEVWQVSAFFDMHVYMYGCRFFSTQFTPLYPTILTN
jgi:hypothetical protein